MPSVDRGWVWHAGCGSVIWQLMFPDSGHVIGQKRYPALRTTSFFCLDALTGRVLCDDFVLTGGADPDVPAGEGWMVGLETTVGDLVVMHAWLAGSPEHQGLWAVDLTACKVVWKRPDLVFAANLGTSLLAFRQTVFAGFPEREYLLVDPLNGEETERFAGRDDEAIRRRYEAEPEASRQGIILPEVSCCVTTGNPVETIVYGSLTVDGLHRLRDDGEGWDARIRITENGEAVHEGPMADRAPQPLLNNYLMRESSIYYIEKNEKLVSVRLS